MNHQKPFKIPFEFIEGDTAIVVPAKLNNERSVNLIFDTGAGVDIISSNIAKELLIEPLKTVAGKRLNNEQVKLSIGLLDSLKFGELHLKNSFIASMDYFNELSEELNIHGLLSLKSFEKTPVTVDYKNKKIIIETFESLEKIKKTGAIIPIHTERQTPETLTAQLDFLVKNKWIQKAMIDTGSAPTKLPMKYFDLLKLSKNDPDLKVKSFKTIGGTKEYAYFLPQGGSISIKGHPNLRNTNKPVRFQENLRMGAIGGNFFMGKKVTFVLEEKIIVIRK